MVQLFAQGRFERGYFARLPKMAENGNKRSTGLGYHVFLASSAGTQRRDTPPFFSQTTAKVCSPSYPTRCSLGICAAMREHNPNNWYLSPQDQCS